MTFQRSQWNQLISQVNDVRASPPSDTDCEPLPPIDELPPNTIWKRSHVSEVQNALAETCSEISFSEPESGLWDQSILNEISGKLDLAWCDCEEECDDPSAENGMEWELFTQGTEVFSNCGGKRPAPAQLPASSFIGGIQLERGIEGRLWHIVARRPGFSGVEAARGRVSCGGSLEDPFQESGIYDATGITVFCTGSCEATVCINGIAEAEQDVANGDLSAPPATYWLSIMALSAECNECPPV